MATNLRDDGVPFVGRDPERSRIGEWIGAGRRLVTIVGPPGAGKTHLARRVALDVAPRFAPPEGGGAWFLDLTDARRAEDLWQLAARTLGVALTVDEAAGGAREQLVAALGARGPTLLVLDNFEQLVEDGAGEVARWLASAPSLALLVTSRERLRLSDEQILPLGPLDLPADGGAESDAVTLFVERARAVRPGWEPTPGERVAVAEVVRLLDGLPLPIVLAASRVGLLSPAELRDRLIARGSSVVGRGPRDAAPRQASLEDAIAWSWDLLEEHERDALRRCAVFRGGFDLEAAEEVLATDGARDVLETLDSLRNKSLVARDEGPPPRFRLLASVRDFARARLEGEAEADAVARHAARYGDWAARTVGRLERLGRAEDRDALARDAENLRAVAALASADDAALRGYALDALLGLEALLRVAGPPEAHRRTLEAALAIDDVDAPRALRRALALARAQSRSERGRPSSGPGPNDGVEEAVGAARRSGQPVACVEALALASEALVLGGGSLERAGALADEAREQAAATNDRWAGAVANLTGARVALARGRPAAATAALHDALRVADELGAAALGGDVQIALSRAASLEGRAQEARDRADDALERLGATGDPLHTAWALVRQVEAAVDLADVEAAERSARQLRTVARELADARLEGRARLAAALCAMQRGEARARTELEAAERCARDASEILLRARVHLATALALRMHGDAGARAMADAARELLAERDPVHAALATATCAGLIADTGATEDAHRTSADARALLGDALPEPLDVTLALYEAWVELATAGDGDAAIEALERAHGGTPSLRDRSIHVRLAARLVASMLPADRRRGVLLHASDPRGEALVVGDGCTWFRPPGGDVIDIAARQKLVSLLGCLVEPRTRGSTDPVPLEAVLAGVWPEERILPDAAANRVYATVALLRKAGLRDLLCSGPDGYRIDPSVRVVVLSEP